MSSNTPAAGDQPARSSAGSPAPPPPPASAPSPSASLPIPQIPPHPAHAATATETGSPSSARARSPLYFGSPRTAPQFGAAGAGASSPLPPNALPGGGGGFDSPNASGIPLTDAQKAEVIRKHLLNAEEQQRVALDQAAGASSPRAAAAGAAFPQAQAEQRDTLSEEYPTPYHLEGGDVVAGVYKWVAQQQQAAGESGISTPAAAGSSGVNTSGVALGAGGGAGGGVGAALRRSRSAASLQPAASAAGGGGGSRRTSLAGNNGGGDAGRAAARLALGVNEAGDDNTIGAIGSDAGNDSAIAIEDDGLTTAEMLQPGGFRRDFVIRKQQQQQQQAIASGDPPNNGGSENASLFSHTAGETGSFVNVSVPGATTPNRPVYGRPTRSFIDFLSLYGHFGGEDLEEIEEEEEEEEEDDEFLEDEEAAIGSPGLSVDGQRARFSDLARQQQQAQKSIDGAPGPLASLRAGERTPLLRNRSSVRSTRSMSRKRGASGEGAGADGEGPDGMKDHGDATVAQAVMMLLKSFVGTGVLFLGKAFYNGGILFSIITLCFIAMISLYSFLLLVQCSLVIPGSFGDIGGKLYGKYMRLAILFSIVLSQVGFVAAYTVFISQNLQAFFLAVSNCRTYISVALLITAQTVIFLPFALIRNIQKLSGTALVADVFIVVGLIYIFSNEIALLSKRGIADVKLFNSKDFPLLIGTAVFAFEGIGLILPVAESMREPHKFPRVLTGVMIGTMLLFAGGGALGYLTYGSKIQTVVFVNLPQDDKFVNASQFLYSIAILLSTPLQLFPAVRIMENGIFAAQKSGKRSLKVKWEKNAFRTFVVVVCALIAWFGAADLDKFVSLIGSLACVPLGLIYPALLHLKACARTRKQKAADIALIVFGAVATIYTTKQTIELLLSPSDGPASPKPHCPPRRL
ncbi:hypothetical protein JCM10908_006275 [Rhodotorula pacifica]|uniref:amino acid transporter n=1 Tax=Rhodotorula pacifica TaxID=1495444 RepID=UPI00317F82B0